MTVCSIFRSLTASQGPADTVGDSAKRTAMQEVAAKSHVVGFARRARNISVPILSSRLPTTLGALASEMLAG
jgi:hypothetical protein